MLWIKSDLADSRKTLRKVQIDVEGSIDPYYWKQRICTRVKKSCDETRKLVEYNIP